MATPLPCSPTALRTRSQLSALSVAELVVLARHGDEAAWDELVTRLQPVINTVTRRHRLRAADAADVAQFTWLQLTRHLTRLHDPARAPGWVATTARHECLKLLRRSQRESLVDGAGEERAHPGGGDDPADAVLAVERRRTVHQAFGQLPARRRQLLHLLMWEDAPYRTISETMGVPVGTIGPTRERCLHALARRSDIMALA